MDPQLEIEWYDPEGWLIEAETDWPLSGLGFDPNSRTGFTDPAPEVGDSVRYDSYGVDIEGIMLSEPFYYNEICAWWAFTDGIDADAELAFGEFQLLGCVSVPPGSSVSR